MPPFPQYPGSQITPEMQAFLTQLQAWRAGNNYLPQTGGHQGPGGSWIGTINWGEGPARLKAALQEGWEGRHKPTGGMVRDQGQASNWHMRYLAWRSGNGPHPGPNPLTGQMYLDPSHAPAAAPAPAPPAAASPAAAPLTQTTDPGQLNYAGPLFPPGPPAASELYPTPDIGEDAFAGGPAAGGNFGATTPAPAPVQRAFPTTSVPVGNMPPIGTGVGGGGTIAAKGGAVPYLNYLLGR